MSPGPGNRETQPGPGQGEGALHENQYIIRSWTMKSGVT